MTCWKYTARGSASTLGEISCTRGSGCITRSRLLPSYIKKEILQQKHIEYVQTTDLASVMPDLDILYMTRVQRERFFNEADYVRLKDTYVLTPDKLALASEGLRVMHPLPRVNEISPKVDDDPRAVYFKQVRNGRYVRMALITRMLAESGREGARA